MRVSLINVKQHNTSSDCNCGVIASSRKKSVFAAIFFGLILILAGCNMANVSHQDQTGHQLVGLVNSPELAALRTAPRLALVIGNNNYNSSWDRLRLSENDANAIANMLYQRGFTLIGGKAQLNVSSQKFHKLINETEATIRVNPGAVVVVYFAGHGFIDNGHDYLVPIDAPEQSTDVHEQSRAVPDSIRVIEMAQRLKAAGSGIIAMFLDACHASKEGRSGGLADETAPDNVFIGFAAQFGTHAFEPDTGDHGYYTTALLQSLDSGFERFDDLHYAVSSKVIRATSMRQVPVFRQGIRMPDVPIRLAASDAQTAYALVRRSTTQKTDLSAAQCAAQTDIRFLLKIGGADQISYHGLQIGPLYDTVDINQIDKSCTDAYTSGNRNSSVLRGLAMAKIGSKDKQQIESGLAFLGQAAESGDGLSNFIMANVASKSNSNSFGLDFNQIPERLKAASERNEPLISGLVSMMLWSPMGEGFRVNSLLLDKVKNKELGSYLFHKSVMSGDPIALFIAILLKERNDPIVSDINVQSIIDDVSTNNIEFGIFYNGVTVKQTLLYESINEALMEKNWSAFIQRVLQVEPYFDRIDKISRTVYDEHPAYPGTVLMIAGLMLASGTDSNRQPIEGVAPNPTMCMRLLRHALALGIHNEEEIRNNLEFACRLN